MDEFEVGTQIYREGRQLFEFTRDLAVGWFDLKIDREDLEEVLLDLKLAVIDRDLERVVAYSEEAKHMMMGIYLKLARRGRGGE